MPAADLRRRTAAIFRGAVRWIVAWCVALVIVLLLLGATAGLVLAHSDGGRTAAWARSTGRDAVWLGRNWARGDYTSAQLRALTSRIADSGVSDVYVFTGQLAADGRLSPAGYARSARFLAAFHAALPRVRVSAWLAGVLGGEATRGAATSSSSGPISLADPAARAGIVASAAAVLRAGFSGVQYDLEPVANGNVNFLRLLAATAALRPAPRPLSVAAPKIEPLAGLRLPWQLTGLGPVYWTPGYLSKVAGLAGEVALMSYDTAMPFPSWYGGYVVTETELALRAVPGRVRLLIGVPCYHNSDLAHEASAETAAASLHGIRVALTAVGRRQDFGVALFADYSATTADWMSYRTGWLRPG